MIVAALILSGTFVLCMHFLKDTARDDEKSSSPAENKTTYNIYNTNSHNSYTNSCNTTNTTTTNEDNVSEIMIKDEIAKLQKDILEKEKALVNLYKEINKLND